MYLTKCPKFITLLLMALSTFISGCDTIWEVDGSFEETLLSGRLNSTLADGQDTRRYFRLHLRQFEDAVGGTFETFDLDNYTAFTRVPEYMDQSMTRYYCARIDYGYVRGDEAYISFTDREQRHWTMNLNLGERVLYGDFVRTDSHRIELNNIYLMPEDAAFVAENKDGTPKHQVEFASMGVLGERALDCVYYFKSRHIDFVLPSAMNLEKLCEPSKHQCKNFRLAIIGVQAQHHVIQHDLPPLQEIMTAYLDDCDIDENQIRSINLRENPHAFHTNSNGIFVATAIIYQDLNLDSTWDKADEPIFAMLNGQSLVFYEDAPTEDVYGTTSSHEPYEDPVLTLDYMTAFPGWQIYNDQSDGIETNPYIRIIKRLTPYRSKYLYFKAENLNPEDPDMLPGCYIRPDSPHKLGCSQLLPILLQ